MVLVTVTGHHDIWTQAAAWSMVSWHSHTRLWRLRPVQDVAQDLCRHDDNAALHVHADVARLQADALRSEARAHLDELLVAQRLQGRRVDDALAPARTRCRSSTGARFIA